MRIIVRAIAAAFLIAFTLPSVSVAEKPLETVNSLIQAGASDSALNLLHSTIVDTLWRAQTDQSTLAKAYLQIAQLYYKSRKYDSALLYADTASSQFVTEDTVNPDLISEIYELQGKILRRLRRSDDAQIVFEKLVSLYKETNKSPDPKLAKALNLLAVTQREAGQLQASIITAKEAISTSEAVGSTENTKTAQYYNTLARAHQQLDQLDKAATLYHRAIELSLPTLGNDNLQLTAFYNNLGNVYSNLGRFSEALDNYTTALTIREENLGMNDMKVAQSLNNIALVYSNTGDYAEAESRYQRAMIIFQTKLGPRHEYVGAMSINLGAMYLDQRRFADAEEVLLNGMSIFNEINPDGHPQMAGILNNLAIVCRNTKRNEEARKYLNQALSLKINRYGEKSPRIASTLNSLGVLAFAQSDYPAAEQYLKQALTIKMTAYGDTHPEIGGAVLNLGELYSRQDMWSKADSLFEQAISIWTSVYGSSNRWVAEAQERQAVSFRRQGRFLDAWNLLKNAYDIRLALFAKNIRVLSEPDALAFSTFLRHTTDLLLSTWTDLESSSQKDSIIASVVFSNKGIVWDELAHRAKSWSITGDSATNALTKQLRSTSWQLARAYVNGPSENHQDYHLLLDSLADQAEEYELLLAKRDSGLRQRLEKTNPGINDITTLLPDQTILIDYMRFNYWPPIESKPTPHYLAVVLSSNNLKSVPLGSAEIIDKRVEDYRKHFQLIATFGEPMPGDQFEYTSIATDLYSALISPLKNLIPSEANLLLAPDGPLCLIAWAGLMPNSSSYLLEQHQITYLGSGRDLLNTESSDVTKRGLLAIGDVDFNFSSDFVANDSKEFKIRNDAMPLNALKGSGEEVKAIVATWKENCSEPVEVLTASNATEKTFKEKAPRYNVLHLATHGFYDNRQSDIETYDLMDYTFKRPIVDNPLLRSGLYFAGVNIQPEKQTADTEDGVLTALEVSTLALTGTDIVVLSACETGLGTILEGEGVSGLRRAFHLAGAETVISALWQISDSRTAKLMRSLYNDNALDMRKRLLKYQREELNSIRSAGESDHPFYWAAFIAISHR